MVRRLALTKHQRSQLFDGQAPRIEGNGSCPVQAGYHYRVSSLLSLEVLKVRRKAKGGWSLEYCITDKRDPVRLLRRTPSIHFEEWSQDKPRKTDAEVAEESAYTTGGLGAIRDAGEAPDVSEYAKQNQHHHELRELARRAAWERRSLAERAAELESLAPLSQADISRELRLAAHALSKAKQKLDRAEAA